MVEPAPLVLCGSLLLTAVGAAILVASAAYPPSLLGSLLIGCGLASIFPIMLGKVGDPAAGKSFEAWVKKYWEKRAAGEKNIQLTPEALD